MSERLKEVVLKTTRRVTRLVGSNPTPSAKSACLVLWPIFLEESHSWSSAAAC